MATFPPFKSGMLKLLHALSLYLSFFMDGADRGKISGCKCHTPSFNGRQITVITVYELCKILGQKKFLAIRYGNKKSMYVLCTEQRHYSCCVKRIKYLPRIAFMHFYGIIDTFPQYVILTFFSEKKRNADSGNGGCQF
jgi:hypothetical protein